MLTIEELTEILVELKDSHTSVTISCEGNSGYVVEYLKDNYGNEFDFDKVPKDFSKILEYVKAINLVNSYN